MGNDKSFEQIATHVSMVSIIGNLILSLFKFIAGIVANSGAMISDAVHSSSDVISSVIVIIGVRISAKESDREHPYGHERMECVASIILSVILAVTGLFIAWEAILKISSGNYNKLSVPGYLALIAAVVSIIAKEGMYQYTRVYAKRIDSLALMADAWHHRSDALSSIGALIGIGGAIIGFKVLEPVASIVICVFILKAAYDIFLDSIDKMVDHSCDEDTEKEIYDEIMKVEGVIRIDMLQTRIFGSKIYVDVEIAADGNKKLIETHQIAENVHNNLEERFPKIKHIMVHVNPAEQ
ncbi:MAG: cation transporter [Lachnospiraceae bacterium]|nr:cation transporter [Lachnospiraceae bacterium]